MNGLMGYWLDFDWNGY